MKRRILSIFLAIAILCCLFPTGVANAEVVVYVPYPVQGGYIYFVPGWGEIVDYDSSVTAANIPSTIGGVAVTGIADKAFWDSKALTSVTIPSSVKSIGYEAFWGCQNLKSVTIQKGGSTSIGDYAFSTCTSLTSVTLSDSVKSIGNNAFWGCRSLQSIVIPGSVASLGNYVFSNCSGLANVTISNGVKSIGYEAFWGCDNLKSVTVPGSVTNMDGAFDGCSGLTSVTIQKGVTSIRNAFNGCSKLTSVTLPYGVTDITGAFEDCSSLKSVAIPDSVTEIGDLAFDGCSSLTSVTIPDSVTEIGDFAFDGCSSLVSVSILGSVKRIGEYAFYDCSSLVSVSIPASLSSVGGSAFSGCSSLRDVYYAGGEDQWHNISIESSIWSDNGPLTRANIHFNAFLDVPGNEFYADAVDWAVQRNITTGTSKEKFSPLYNCTRGQIVTFLWRANGSPEPTSTGNPFVDVPKDQYYYKAVLWAVEKNITTGIDQTHFKPDNICKRGQAVTFLWRAAGEPAPTSGANPFVDVPKGQFYHDAVLWAVEKNITTGTTATTFKPDNICTRGHIVTFLYRALAQSDIPDVPDTPDTPDTPDVPDTPDTPGTLVAYPVEGGNLSFDPTTGEIVFCDGSVTVANIPSEINGVAVTSIGERAFFWCGSLESVTIPDSVTSIGSYAFDDCSSLESVTIPGSVTSIGSYTFGGCSSLESVTIPNSVTEIGYSAFWGCGSLTAINVASENPNYSSDQGVLLNKEKTELIEYPGGLTGAYKIPDSVTRICISAFLSCSGLTSVVIPTSVTEIESSAFLNCNNLKDVFYMGSEAQWQQVEIFGANEPLTEATIHYNSTGLFTDVAAGM